jgi:hypothetical protein
MVQASIRLRQLLGRPVPLVQMFQYPTARALAAAIGSTAGDTGSTNADESANRASQRREALQRRRAARPGR